jgi:phenylacetyl-CoA:acceptor oxidoreductase subunit 1
MTRWGMVIDLKRCMGCYSCMVGCKQEHFLPPNVYWTRLLVSETGQYPQVANHIYPVLCNHCKEPICVRVCPSGATGQREDGLINIDYDKCVGCGYCIIACPYQQRTLYKNSNVGYFPNQGLTEFEVIGKKLFPLQSGTVVKCNFCKEKIDQAVGKGLKPGLDREATPACVNNCPVKARCFGNIDDPNSEVSILIRQRKGFQLRPEFGTDPSVYYVD